MDYLQAIYRMSPIWIQNLGVSAFGLYIRRTRLGGEFDGLFEEFSRRQWDSTGALEDYQNQRLQRLIRHAYENVPYYRQIMDERQLRPLDFRTPSDLPKLPLLRKERLRNQPDTLRARNFSWRHLWPGETSGTSGSPLRVYWNKQMVVLNAVAEWRQKSWAGLKRGDRFATLMSGRASVPLAQKKPPYWRYNRPLNQMLLSAYHLHPDYLPHYVRALREFNPVVLEAYPSTAFVLAQHILHHDGTLPLKSVITTSETLYPYQREAIEEAFSCRVYSFYGMAERVVFCSECEAHSGLHLNMDYGVTEIVDSEGRPVTPGTLGNIAGTSLHNIGMPLIRYVTSDVASLRPEPCSCGRAFPLMDGVVGRSSDFLVASDGRQFPSTAVEILTTDTVRNLGETQIIQESTTHLVVNVVKGPHYADADTLQLVSNLKSLLGPEVRIDINFVPVMERTAAGKLRLVVSKVPLES